MSRFAGRAAVVTGGARGIGRAVAAGLVAEGAGVVILDLDGDLAAHSAAELGCAALGGDVVSRDDVRRAVEACLERFGRLDVMVAHAGVAHAVPLLDVDDDEWRRHMAVNVDGAFICTQEAARTMVAGGTGGAIVVTASINAFHVEETMAAYNTSKGAVVAFVRSAAIDLARHGIRVNAVAPGVVTTRMAALVTEDPSLSAHYLRTMPLGRFGKPEEIAAAVLFLASDDASYVTGHSLVIDGGQTLGIMGDLVEASKANAGDAPPERAS